MAAIPETVRKMATARVALEFRERHDAIAKEVGRVKGEMGARGMLYSGMTIQRIREAVGREYDVRASIAWNVWARALSAGRVEVTPALAEELKAQMRRHLEDHCGDLVAHYEAVQNLVGGAASTRKDELAEPREHAIAKVSSEIDLGLLEAGQPAGATGGGGAHVFNIYSPVGAIQTGAGSTASVHMSLTDQERGPLLEALQAIEQAMGEAQLPSEVSTQVAEAVVVARTEIQKSKPNMLTLRGVLAGIGGTVQTLGSAAAAYQLLKGAAAAIGLHLP